MVLIIKKPLSGLIHVYGFGGVCRQLEVFQELFFMRDFEKTENSLYEKLEEKSTEKLNVDKQVS